MNEADQVLGVGALERTSILVVDDRPDKILVFRSVLEDLGQDLVTVGSGEEALKQVLERDFAVILLDVNMPGMDGFEAAALIRKRKRSSHTPIIFMTAYADEMHAAQAYELGAVDFILTPFAPEVLRAKVRVFVHLHQMAEQVRRQTDQRVALAREQAARAAAEEAMRRAAFLAEAGRLLTSSLDPEALARDVTHYIVPVLGGFAALALLDEQGRVARTEMAWSDPETTTGRRALCVRRILEPAVSAAIDRALASGRLEEAGDVLPERGLRVERLESTNEERVTLAFPLSTLAVHPLSARGRTFAALAVALAPPRVRFTPAEQALGQELAGRLDIALDNAILHRRVRDNDRRKDEFLAMLAHELRSPLAPIRNAIEVLRLRGTNEERWNWARGIIDRQSTQLVRLVDDLLDVSRITSGKIQLKAEEVELAGILDAAVETSRPLIEERGHQLTVTPPSDALVVRGDASRIAQVLANLLNNAAKYTPPGGRVSISATAEAGEAVVRIADSGVGIPATMLESIFDLFTQVDNSLDRSHGGLGIGLTLVRRLVEAQHGSVKVASAGQNQGSEFTVRLPLVTAPAKAAVPPSALPRTSRRRVLIVEDHADTAETLESLVAIDGHEVCTVGDGQAALDVVGDFRPDVLLVDIGLPGMDGFELARRLRACPQTRRSLVVAVTGYGQDRDRRRAADAGFDDLLPKPVNVQQLMALLRLPRHATEVS